MQVLLINGHEKWPHSQGKLNQSLVDVAANVFIQNGHEVSITLVESDFDIPSEVEKFKQADLVIYFTPVYWMGVPAAFKFYTDRVYSGGRGILYEHDGRQEGGEYGSAGLLKSKYALVTTFNAPENAFETPGSFLFNGKSVDDLFFNFHCAQRFIGLAKLPTFSLHDVVKVPDFENYKIKFEKYLNQLI